MVGQQVLALLIGVRIPASEPVRKSQRFIGHFASLGDQIERNYIELRNAQNGVR